MTYVYGPVPSRRLGRSIGVDPLPPKTCNYQCIYCQLGKTTHFTNKRANFYPLEDIITDMQTTINNNRNKFDYVTFVGSGEPTLYKDIGILIQKAKEFTDKRICVITNGSLLNNKEVSNDLMNSDVVMPSLDAGNEEDFIKINRPHPQIKYQSMVQGLIDFNKKYNGYFWLEVMLMKDINDSREKLLEIKQKINLIQPDRVDINVPIRPPTEDWVEIPNDIVYERIREIFEDYSNINFPEKGIFEHSHGDFERELLRIITRHPMREKQIIKTFSNLNLDKKTILEKLTILESKNVILKKIYNNQIFWRKK
ncbi:MAG: radical SAM protein [Promethearchaeota archaeon]|nr:MAG: radical SAM protein [Candidatus Lokiarchaeota archaeon]